MCCGVLLSNPRGGGLAGMIRNIVDEEAKKMGLRIKIVGTWSSVSFSYSPHSDTPEVKTEVSHLHLISDIFFQNLQCLDHIQT